MGCRVENLTAEQLSNVGKYASFYTQKFLNQTAEETVAKLRNIQVAHQKIGEDYEVLGYVFPEKKRVSNIAKKKKWKTQESLTDDNKIKREGGTHVHETMALVMNYLANKEGSFEEAKTFALSGPIKLNANQFAQLVKLGKKILSDIEKTQREIDPKGKHTVLVEQFLPDFIDGIAGTEDIVVVFSNNTVGIYDFKTRYGKIDSSGKITSNPFPYYEIDDKHISQAEYKRILEERIGADSVIQNRLIPIAVQYKNKSGFDNKEGYRLDPEISSIATVVEDMEHLRAIPVGGELSKWEGITNIVEKQFKLIKALSSRRDKSKNIDERSHLASRIKRIDKSIGNLLVDEDISEVTTSMEELALEVALRLDEPKMKDGVSNNAYLKDEDIESYRNQMKLYANIIEDTDIYFKEIKVTYPEKYVSLVSKLDSLKGPFERVYVRLNEESQYRRGKEIPAEYKDDKGMPMPYKELNFGDLKWANMSEIHHPVFEAAWNVLEKSQDETKQRVLSLGDEIYSAEAKLFEWAKNNLSGSDKKTQAYRMLINEKTGNMYSKLRKGVYKDINDKIDNGGLEAMKIAKKYYDFKNQEDWQKEYKNRLEGFKAIRKAAHSNFAATMDGDKVKISGAKKKELYDKEINQWIDDNDLLKSSKAWTIASNRRSYLTLKPEIVEENLSDEYRKIRSIKPLHDFYEMWNKKMEEFAKILGISDYSKLPPNFIPNVRKEMMEYMDANGWHLGKMAKEFKDSLHVREEDTYVNSFDSDGFEREIPILFVNKFFNDKGVDNSVKIFDLGKSMMIFGRMAYTYESMHSIEATLNGLKNLLGDPLPGRGGTEVTDRLSKRIKGRIRQYTTRKGEGTDTYKLFEDLIDFYLYGIKFKNKTMLPGVDVIHFLTKAKNVNSILKLSFAITPATGAWVAGTTGLTQLASKNIQFNKTQLANSYKMMVTDATNISGLCDFFDASNDDYFERELQRHIVSAKNKALSSRTGFLPLRGADKQLSDTATISMAQNWGVKEDGGIIRLNRKVLKDGKMMEYKEAYPGKYKTILELLEKGDNGKYTIKGLSRDGYRQFRYAIKSTVGEVIGNMNPDDASASDVDFYLNQMMAFKTWMPALIREYTGALGWNEKTQSMKWGRFRAYLNDYRKDLNFTEDQIAEGKIFWEYMGKVVAPGVGRLILDISTFGLVPTIKNSRINEKRCQIYFRKWQKENPGLIGKVTYEDFLEIKQGQIKAMLVQLRFLVGIMGLAMFLGGTGDDGKKRYMENWVTRTMYKTFTKAGSELTFMWNPSEFIRLTRNPFPVTGLLLQLQKTVFNGFDESKELIFGPDQKDKTNTTPAGYYLLQWMWGGSQLERFFELYKNFEKSQYQVFSTTTQ